MVAPWKAEASPEVAALRKVETMREPQALQQTEAWLEAETSWVAVFCLRAAGFDSTPYWDVLAGQAAPSVTVQVVECANRPPRMSER